MRAELVDSKAKKECLEHEMHNFLLQLHSTQLAQIPENVQFKKNDQYNNIKPDISIIKKKLEAEIKQSPLHINKSICTDRILTVL